jgi:hypothetical protein
MLRCTKTSPGCRPRRVVSGTRESEHPSQRIVGDWPVARLGKKEGFWCVLYEAQEALEERA